MLVLQYYGLYRKNSVDEMEIELDGLRDSERA